MNDTVRRLRGRRPEATITAGAAIMDNKLARISPSILLYSQARYNEAPGVNLTRRRFGGSDRSALSKAVVVTINQSFTPRPQIDSSSITWWMLFTSSSSNTWKTQLHTEGRWFSSCARPPKIQQKDWRHYLSWMSHLASGNVWAIKETKLQTGHFLTLWDEICSRLISSTVLIHSHNHNDSIIWILIIIIQVIIKVLIKFIV